MGVRGVGTQESVKVRDSRSARITCAVSPGELADIRLVAKARDEDESVVLRDRGLPWVRREAKRLRQALRSAA